MPNGVCVLRVGRHRLRFVVVAAVAAVALYAAAAGASRSRSGLAPITGNLSQHGYTVMALAYNGKAITAKGSDFSVAPPASPVTLLIAVGGLSVN